MNSRRDVTVLKLLLKYGGDVRGKKHRFLFASADQLVAHYDTLPGYTNHFPMFSAAHAMGRDGDVRPAEILIEHGADVNQQTTNLLPFPRAYIREKLSVGHVATRQPRATYKSTRPAPVYVNLESTLDWSSQNQMLRPKQGLEFWLKNGVVFRDGIPVHDMSTADGPWESLACFLVRIRGLRSLEYDGFYEIMLYLMAPENCPRGVQLPQLCKKSAAAESELVQSRWDDLMRLAASFSPTLAGELIEAMFFTRSQGALAESHEEDDTDLNTPM